MTTDPDRQDYLDGQSEDHELREELGIDQLRQFTATTPSLPIDCMRAGDVMVGDWLVSERCYVRKITHSTAPDGTPIVTLHGPEQYSGHHYGREARIRVHRTP